MNSQTVNSLSVLLPSLLLLPSGLLAAPASARPQPAPRAASQAGSSAEVEWYQGAYMSALGRARHEERMLCLYFWSGGSPNCQRLFQETLGDPAVVSLLADFVCYSADAADANGARLLARYQVSTVPTVLLLNAQGEAQDAIIGFADPLTFAAEVARIQSGQETVGSLRALCRQAPADLGLRLRLSVKLGVVGAVDEQAQVLDSIRRDDPSGETLVGARLAFWDVRDPLQAQLDAGADPARVDLKPLYAHLKRIQQPAVRFEAWEWLANAEFTRGSRVQARAAYLKAWPELPAGRELEWGSRVVLVFWGMREELSSDEKRALLEVAAALEVKARELLSAAQAVDPATPLPPLPDGQTPETAAAMALSASACAWQLNGNVREARKLAREALELSPEDGELVARLDPILKK